MVPESSPVLRDSTPEPASNQEAPEPIARFDDVSKTYDGKVLAVASLDLDILDGEFLTLLGPSGSGKTTSLMLLAGFEKATSGRILMGGRDVSREAVHKRELGVVFQDYALFPHMTVAENVGYPLKVRRVSAVEKADRISSALDMVQLTGFGDRMPGQLSGGQQQRVALARALVFSPRLVLMDEPLGALDKQLREHMQLEIKHLQKRLEVTVVYVTHDQSEALTMSDRIAVFKAGRIEQLDTPTGLYENPETAFVAGFIGENNLLEGRLTGIVDGIGVTRLEGGATVRSACRPGLEVGDGVLVSIRPERIALGEGGTSASCLQARVNEAIYLGSHVKLRMSVNGAEITALLGPDTSAGMPPPGDHVSLSWRPDDAQLLPVR